MSSHLCHVVASPQFEIRFGTDETKLSLVHGGGILEIPSPLLGGVSLESYEVKDGRAKWLNDQLLILENENRLFGATILPIDQHFQQQIQDFYSQLLRYSGSRGFHLHRIWNFVPDINSCVTGLENYRHFNLGRWKAFEENLGSLAEIKMPAASAVGVNGDHFVCCFIAGVDQPDHLENPRQTPAYRYPSQYGPKPPGFARATVVRYPEATWGFVSGTASIHGHETVGQGNWRFQYETTMSNILTMLHQMKMRPSNVQSKSVWETLQEHEAACIRDWRCYLRHSEMFPLIRDCLHQEYGLPHELITFQLADICRSDLDLEFEVTLIQKPTGVVN